MSQPSAKGYVPVGEMELYWESYGSGGTPLVMVHGGFGVTTMFGGLLDALAQRRRVVAIELQGHGHTRDVARPFTYEAFGDDMAAVINYLGLGPADLLGFSLGGGATLRAAIQYPGLVRRLVLMSFPFRREGWFPEIRAAFDNMSSRVLFDQMKHSPMYAAWREVAPDPDAFPGLIDKTAELQRRLYDWSDEVRRLTMPVLLVFGDADSIPITHAAEFFALLDGGLRDAGWDGSARPPARLAVLPGRSHYDLPQSGQLAGVLNEFLA